MSLMNYENDCNDDWDEQDRRDDHDRRDDRDRRDRRDCDEHEDDQTHDHEFLDSVRLAEQGNDRHNHRFAGVTSEVIKIKKGGHKHAFMVNTDFFGHHHEVAGETGPAIHVGNGKHVHFAEGLSTTDDDHYHEYQFATLIDSPLQHH